MLTGYVVGLVGVLIFVVQDVIGIVLVVVIRLEIDTMIKKLHQRIILKYILINFIHRN